MKRTLSVVLIFLAFVFFRLWLVKSIEFTNIEHLLVYRSWTLAKFGTDEFGRHLPFLFGSSDGMELPGLSYLSSGITYFFGSNLLSEQILDFVYFVLPGLVAICFGYGYLFSSLLLASPIFFWPGNWEAKLLTSCLLIIWKLLTENKNIIYLILAGIVSIMISFSAWFICPLILLIGYFKNNLNYKTLIVMASTIVLSLMIIKSDRNVLSHIKSNYFNFNQNVSILNSINSFRGQDLKTENSAIGRVFHNKLQYIPVLLGQSLMYISPSFLFAVGDKNTLSNSMWVPPYLSIYFFLLILSLYLKKDKENNFYYFWILAVSVFIGLTKFPQTEQHIYLISLPLLLIISKALSQTNKYMVFIFILGLVNLFALGMVSGTVSSTYKETCSLNLLTEIVKVTKNAGINTAFITDDVCSDLGPGIAMLQGQQPIKTNDDHFNKIIRHSGNVKIISPSGISESMISENKVLILSDNLAEKFVKNLPKKKIVSKQLIFKGRNVNNNMYLIKQEPSENI